VHRSHSLHSQFSIFFAALSKKVLCFFKKLLCFFKKLLCFFKKLLCFFKKELCFLSKDAGLSGERHASFPTASL
jgi:hypothetical protein